MTSKMALGSVSTLAVGALLLGAMPYVVSRTMSSSHAAPWGAISGLAAASSSETGASSDSDRAQLMKLASLKSDPSSAAATAPAPVEPMATDNDAPAKLQAAVAVDTLPKGLPLDATLLTATPAPMQAVSPSDVEINTAAVEPSSDTPKASAVAHGSASVSDVVNINTASMEALDRFPGVGRVGHAIMVHRPYRAVADLVRKRVLRMSDFQKIQSRVRVD